MLCSQFNRLSFCTLIEVICALFLDGCQVSHPDTMSMGVDRCMREHTFALVGLPAEHRIPAVVQCSAHVQQECSASGWQIALKFPMLHAGCLVRIALAQLWQLLLQLQATPGQPQLEAGARDVCGSLASACDLSSSDELTSLSAPALLQRLNQARQLTHIVTM